MDPLGAWLVTSYDAVLEVLRQPEQYSSLAMRARNPSAPAGQVENDTHDFLEEMQKAGALEFVPVSSDPPTVGA